MISTNDLYQEIRVMVQIMKQIGASTIEPKEKGKDG